MNGSEVLKSEYLCFNSNWQPTTAYKLLTSSIATENQCTGKTNILKVMLCRMETSEISKSRIRN